MSESWLLTFVLGMPAGLPATVWLYGDLLHRIRYSAEGQIGSMVLVFGTWAIVAFVIACFLNRKA